MTDLSRLYKESEQILLGFEQLFSRQDIIAKVRYFVEKLFDDQVNRNDVLRDSFKILKAIGDFEQTTNLERFLLEEEIKERVIALFCLIEALSYENLASHIKLLLKYFELSAENQTTIGNIVVSLLTDLERENEAFFHIKSLYLEKDKLISHKKLMKLYTFLYDQPIFDRFRKLAEHFLTLKSDLEIWNFLFDVTHLKLIERVKVVRQNIPEQRLHEAMSKGQMKSKLWAVDHILPLLDNERNEVILLCGWYGTLASCLCEFDKSNKIQSITNVDIDGSCREVSQTLNCIYPVNYQFVEQNIYNFSVDEQRVRKSVIINTSCEHLDKFDKWYQSLPRGALMALQSNNFFSHKEHVNCVSSLEEFKKMAPMSEVLYAGELPLEKYNRFMLIGYK